MTADSPAKESLMSGRTGQGGPSMAAVRAVANSAIEVRNLRKQFGGTLALKGIDLDVRPGTIHSLVGENGRASRPCWEPLQGGSNRQPGKSSSSVSGTLSGGRDWRAGSASRLFIKN